MKEIWLNIYSKGLRPNGTKGYFIFVFIFFLSEDKKNDVNDKHSEADPNLLWRCGRSMKHLPEKLTIPQEMQLITKNWIRNKFKFLTSLILGNSRLQKNNILYLKNNGTSFKTNQFSFTNLQAVLICTFHYGLHFYTVWNKIKFTNFTFSPGLEV